MLLIFYQKHIPYMHLKSIKSHNSALNKYFASAGHDVWQLTLRASHKLFVPVFCI